MSMTLTDLVAPNAIIPALKVNTKKQAIQELAARAAELTGQNERAILEILLQREKLGSTAVGNGVAIPHGKLPKLGRLFGLFARLERAVDFEALDGQPVDLVFLLLAPEAAGADHLKALARVARLLRDPDIARKLRELARCRRALCRAGDAGGEQRGVARRLSAHSRESGDPESIRHPVIFSSWRMGPRFRGDERINDRLRERRFNARSRPRAPGSRHWRARLRACRSA